MIATSTRTRRRSGSVAPPAGDQRQVSGRRRAPRQSTNASQPAPARPHSAVVPSSSRCARPRTAGTAPARIVPANSTLLPSRAQHGVRRRAASSRTRPARAVREPACGATAACCAAPGRVSCRVKAVPWCPLSPPRPAPAPTAVAARGQERGLRASPAREPLRNAHGGGVLARKPPASDGLARRPPAPERPDRRSGRQAERGQAGLAQ